ncbi:diuretic hormone receptor-like [Tigriopus californicus]|uniref:diuretic hormone receptor-like n=1 Tax=Tigriopus californicus TaxID=6832 RepID=UPI0027DA0CD3|nr:diuretic hormone receptor-like [Tigriopus californicus]
MNFVRKTNLVDDPDMMSYDDETSSLVMDYDQLLSKMNATERLELECAIKEQQFNASRDQYAATLRCPPSFDKISCWPASVTDSLVVIPCFSEFNGVRYDTTKNASRECLSDGTWVSKSNYSMCTVLHLDQTLFNESESVLPHDYSFLIYLVGYSLSLIALFIACGIFFYFKEIHCLRNKIHTNLFVTYILSNMFWILSATIHSTKQDGETNMIWCTSLVFVRFFHLCTFFWMFVEGLYLFVQVIAAFFIDNSCMKLRHYLFIGWGIPFIIVGVWATLTSSLNTGMVNQGVNFRGVQYKITTSNFTTMSPASPSLDCPFMAQNNLEYIYTVPILFVLGLNTFFLVWIMWVVITKLRSSASAAQEHDHQNWKAAKALLVIIPLLGITYLFTISGPSDPTTMPYYIFQHVRAFLLSIQGFAVTLPYCFLNTEIRNVVKNHWDRYQTNRTVVEGIQNVTRGGGQSGRNSFSFYNNDGSRRSSTFRMHFTPTGSNHSGGSGSQNRPRLVHQSSLPASYYVESSFKCPGGASLGGTHGPHPSNGGGANGFKFIRGREHLIDIQKTIEEASDEMKSTSFDQTSTLLPASNSDLHLAKGGDAIAPTSGITTAKVIRDGVINEEEKSDDVAEENEDERECLLVNKFNGRLEMIHAEPASKYGTTANGTSNDPTDVTLSVLKSNPLGSLQEKNVN